MSLPREPRQKMINMMYLVLTALLALNVSAEILNAFKTVNASLEKSNGIVTASTTDVMSSFQRKLNDPNYADQAKRWYPVATKALGLSKDVIANIERLKNEILSEAGANYAKGDSSFKEDNLDIATRLMVDHGEGDKLRQQLADYKRDILAVDPEVAKEFSATLPINLAVPKTQNKGNADWSSAYFRMVPTVAAITMLSKFENDVKTAENKVVTFLHNKVGQIDVVPDTYAAIVGQSSNYLIPGQDLEITAGIGSFNSKVPANVSVGGQGASTGADGVAHIKIPAGGVGAHSLSVHIEFTDLFGKKQVIDKPIEYTVGQTSTAVALDKMNVLFIGVDNPVSISASGDINKVSAVLNGGGGSLIKNAPGQYIAQVTQEGDCNIVVTSEGKTTTHPFRVRSIPDPTPRVGQNKSGGMSAGAFKAQGGVNAVLENFYYQTQFTVTSFHLIAESDSFDGGFAEANNTGAAWNPNTQRIVSKLGPGAVVTIDEIHAVGPDKRNRKLTPLVFNLQ